MVFTIVFVLSSCGCKEVRFKGDYPDVVSVKMLAEDGTPFGIKAVEGQLCVWFKKGVSYRSAKNTLLSSRCSIVSQDPRNGYYLVAFHGCDTQEILDRITTLPGIEWAYPNIVSFPCMTQNYVLDNFYPRKEKNDTTSHGRMVLYALNEAGSDSPLKTYNIGTNDGGHITRDNWEEGYLCPIIGCSHNEYFALKDISKKSKAGPIIINMSYGQSLPERMVGGEEVAYYWKDATRDEKKQYQERYLLSIRGIIKNAKPLDKKDYIIVIAAGNEGVKTFGRDIISYLRMHLSPKETEILNEHFLLVTAGENERIHQEYSNEMEKGQFDPLVTKMNISDFVFNNIKRDGTSFAAPRAAGVLSFVANEKGLTGSEVLKLAREVTEHNGELTKEALLLAADRYQSKLSKSTNHVEHNELVGTKWQHINRNDQLSCVLHFVSDTKVHITNYIRYTGRRDAPYHSQEVDNTYTYDQQSKRGTIISTSGDTTDMDYSKDQLIITGYYNDGSPVKMVFTRYQE